MEAINQSELIVRACVGVQTAAENLKAAKIQVDFSKLYVESVRTQLLAAVDASDMASSRFDEAELALENAKVLVMNLLSPPVPVPVPVSVCDLVASAVPVSVCFASASDVPLPVSPVSVSSETAQKTKKGRGRPSKSVDPSSTDITEVQALALAKQTKQTDVPPSAPKKERKKLSPEEKQAKLDAMTDEERTQRDQKIKETSAKARATRLAKKNVSSLSATGLVIVKNPFLAYVALEAEGRDEMESISRYEHLDERLDMIGMTDEEDWITMRNKRLVSDLVDSY